MAIQFVHHAQAQSTYQPPLIANDNAFLGDVESRCAFKNSRLHKHNYVRSSSADNN